jgi:hypothetical protein
MRNLIRGVTAALVLAALPLAANAGLFVSVSIAPPVLPVYVQPSCPAPGYMWIPGYWAWDDGYYWVPGTWALAPTPGLLWTPGYWGWGGGLYVWHAGYWGPHVGFYGGINYGFGYTGVGYEGGYWHGHDFYYNRAVTNINTTNITNVYNHTVVNNVNVTHVAFNGGAGGVVARPSAAEISAGRERHVGLTAGQRQQQQLARDERGLRAEVNGGRPAIAATARPGAFSGRGVVAARGVEHAARSVPTAMSRNDRPSQAQHPQPSNRNDRPSPAEHPQAMMRNDRAPQAEHPQTMMRNDPPRVEHPQTMPRVDQRPQTPNLRVDASGERPIASAHQPSRAPYPVGGHATSPGAPRVAQPAEQPRGGFDGPMHAPQYSAGRAPQYQARVQPPQGGHEPRQGGGERPEHGQERAH